MSFVSEMERSSITPYFYLRFSCIALALLSLSINTLLIDAFLRSGFVTKNTNGRWIGESLSEVYCPLAPLKRALHLQTGQTLRRRYAGHWPAFQQLFLKPLCRFLRQVQCQTQVGVSLVLPVLVLILRISLAPIGRLWPVRKYAALSRAVLSIGIENEISDTHFAEEKERL